MQHNEELFINAYKKYTLKQTKKEETCRCWNKRNRNLDREGS